MKRFAMTAATTRTEPAAEQRLLESVHVGAAERAAQRRRSAPTEAEALTIELPMAGARARSRLSAGRRDAEFASAGAERGLQLGVVRSCRQQRPIQHRRRRAPRRIVIAEPEARPRGPTEFMTGPPSHRAPIACRGATRSVHDSKKTTAPMRPRSSCDDGHQPATGADGDGGDDGADDGGRHRNSVVAGGRASVPR